MSSYKSYFSKVAIVCDQMDHFGGADREMLSILKLFPNADIFTITFNKSAYSQITQKVYTSKLQRILNILPKTFSRHLKIFTPWVYENFNLEGYDLVISISAGPAKGIITGINQPHIAMTMTPPRSLWDNEHNFRALKLKHLYSGISDIFNVFMRLWDISISKRVNYWTANSKYIQKKIKRTYGVDSQVIYPGIEEKYFKKVSQEDIAKLKQKYSLPDDFVLVVSRLYDYKRVDWAIMACIKADKNLVIVGEGPDKRYLKKIASRNPNIQFLGFLKDDNEVITMYHTASVLLFCGIEDFGLVPVEAMASGTPVLALKEGGALETIQEHTTGEFFETEEELYNLLKNFDKRSYNRKEVINQAKHFSEKNFLNNLEKYITCIYEKETSK